MNDDQKKAEEKLKVTFSGFISGLLAECMMALGLIENPVTKKKEKSLEHAGLVIDTMDMLKAKTSGNLSDEESSGLEEALHQLRMIYIGEVNKEKADPGKAGSEKS